MEKNVEGENVEKVEPSYVADRMSDGRLTGKVPWQFPKEPDRITRRHYIPLMGICPAEPQAHVLPEVRTRFTAAVFTAAEKQR